jgi:hypothetical protein
MQNPGKTIWIAAAALLLAAQAFPQGADQAGRGQAVVTVLPKQHSELAPKISAQDLTVKVNERLSSVTGWTPLRGADDGLELVLLIDTAAHNMNGGQYEEIKAFVQGLAPHTKAVIGYMENGRALLTGPLSADHAQVLRGLHLPGGFSGSSPYFCLSDLARNWPSAARGVRCEVVLVTDGVEPYDPIYDPANTYVQAAIGDSVRAGLVVYSLYWSSRNSAYRPSSQSDGGQNYLADLARATGGNSYWMGPGNPVSFQPFFEDLARRLENQYRLSFTARLDNKPAIESLKLKVGGIAAEVTAPEQVLVDRAGAAAE